MLQPGESSLFDRMIEPATNNAILRRSVVQTVSAVVFLAVLIGAKFLLIGALPHPTDTMITVVGGVFAIFAAAIGIGAAKDLAIAIKAAPLYKSNKEES